MDNVENNLVTYTDMRTTARLNYRTSCSFETDTVAGILEKGAIVKVKNDSEIVAYGFAWCEIKLRRKEFYVCKNWLETV